MKTSGWDAEAWREVLGRLALDTPPVAVRFSPDPPAGLSRLGDGMALCEMLKHAREGASFYADAGSHTCPAGSYVVHGQEAPPPYKSGELGAGLQIFRDAHAAAGIYDHVPTLEPGTARYVAFAPLPQVTFEPDLLVVLAGLRQAEILLRAMSYATGGMWTSKYTNVLGCSWLLAQPHLSGEVNYVTTGFSFGMRLRQVFDEGLQVVSIPRPLFPELLSNLQEMPWVLPAFQPDGKEFLRDLRTGLGLEPLR